MLSLLATVSLAATTCSPLLFPSQVFSFATGTSSAGGAALATAKEDIADAIAKGRIRFVSIRIDGDSGWPSLFPYPVSALERTETEDIVPLTVLTFASGGTLTLVKGQSVPDSFGRLHEVSSIGLGFHAVKADGGYDTVRSVESRPVTGEAFRARRSSGSNPEARLVAGDGYLATLGQAPCDLSP